MTESALGCDETGQARSCNSAPWLNLPQVR